MPVAKKATAAELRNKHRMSMPCVCEDYCRCDVTTVVDDDALDEILAAARAEAVAPVLEVLRELVAAMPRCTAGACGDAACEGCDVMCGRTATRGIVCDEHGEGEPDSDYAAPLRLALALLGVEP